MKLINLQEPRGKSTYLSQILEGEDLQGRRYVVKRNRGKLTEEQQMFFHWLTATKPEHFSIPVELTGRVHENLEEVYEHVDWPLLDEIMLGLFPRDGEPKYGWGFSHALRIIEQLTDTLGSLHSQGYVHHDVRGRNIFLNPNGLEIKLFDYNSVRQPYELEQGVDSWNDVPPEYRKGHCNIDFRFDVYQAGRLFFEMTHGYCKDYKKKILRVDAPTAALEVIAKASDEHQEQRYSDCKEFHRAVVSLF